MCPIRRRRGREGKGHGRDPGAGVAQKMEKHEEHFRLDAETAGDEIGRTGSLPQGDPAEPMLLNIALDTQAVRFEKLARQKDGASNSRTARGSTLSYLPTITG